MLELLTEHKSGKNLDDAIESVYGTDRLRLENDWRSYIGASKYEPDRSENQLPTPIPRPAVGLFSLTPQSGSISVKSTENYDPDNLAVATAEEESVNRNTGKNESPNSSGCNRYDNENKTTDYSMVFLLIAPLLIWSRRKGADD